MDLTLLALVVGWPGLLLGGALGALSRRRRIACAVIGAVLGCAIWFAAAILLRG